MATRLGPRCPIHISGNFWYNLCRVGRTILQPEVTLITFFKSTDCWEPRDGSLQSNKHILCLFTRLSKGFSSVFDKQYTPFSLSTVISHGIQAVICNTNSNSNHTISDVNFSRNLFFYVSFYDLSLRIVSHRYWFFLCLLASENSASSTSFWYYRK